MDEKAQLRWADTESQRQGQDGPSTPLPTPGDDHEPQMQKPASKPRQQEESLLASLCIWVVDHQIGIAMNLLMLLTLTHVSFPKARRHTRKFFTLAYYNPESERYAAGWDDVYFVLLWIVIFTGVRIAVMEYIMTPLAELVGLRKKKAKTRFAEQAWVIAYYTVFWTLGLYIMYNSPYWLRLEYMWADWPDREMDGLLKWYYLVEYALWLQQIVVVNIEERRNDHWQMFTHHIVTCALMFSSYGYHHYRIGNVILVLMDTVDIMFALAKIFRYLRYERACDIVFGTFAVSWVITRHVLYMMVVYSIYHDLPNHIQFGCYSGANGHLQGPFEPPNKWGYLIAPFKDPTGLVCQTQTMQNMFVGMLLFLQGILLVWFAMIVRVIMKVLSGKPVEDTRSDDEDEDEQEEVPTKEMHSGTTLNPAATSHNYTKLAMKDEHRDGGDQHYIEVAANEPSPHRKSSPAQRSTRRGGHASGVSLPHDRKELLGRIGCDKGN